MSAGRVAGAVAVLVVFGGAAVLMGRSALHDWREGRDVRDRATQFLALLQWWPAVLAAFIALAGSIAVRFAS